MKVGREKELLKTRKGLNFNSEHRRNIRGENGIYQVSNYRTIVLISYTSTATLKILQARLQLRISRCSSWFRKGKGTRDQIANICRIIEQAREFQKNIYFCFTDFAKAFDCVDHNKLENSLRWEYQTILAAA